MAKRNGGIIGPANTPTSSVAAGVWRLRDAFNSTKNGTWPLVRSVATNSLRFNSASSDSLTRTPSSETNRKTWTWSFWFKISYINPNGMYIFGASQDGNNRTAFGYNYASVSGDAKIWFHNRTASTFNTNLITTQVFRDISAWYHLVVAVDTTQATSSNRAKIYLNGSQITALDTATYPSQNTDTWVNSANAHAIGKYSGGASDFVDGYITDAYLIDGQQLTPSSFGASNASGVWYPIAYQGTYGTNGFNLKFANSASLGTDSSGNANTFTVNNLTSVDQSTDTGLNNFATWNPLFYYGNQTFTEGNLQIATGTSGASIGTIAVNTGKWYWECKVISTISTARIAGIFQVLGTNTDLSSTGTAYYNADGQKNINGTTSAYGASLTTNDIVGVAIDVDNRSVTYYKNGTSQGAISLTSVFNVGDYITACLLQSGGSSQTVGINFGSPYYSGGGYTDGAGYGNFSYAVPSGYYALCTKNLNTYG